MVFGPMAEPEEVNILKLKPTQKSKKGRELNPKYFDDDEREAFFKSDADQWQKHLYYGAVTVIYPEEAKKCDWAPKVTQPGSKIWYGNRGRILI